MSIRWKGLAGRIVGAVLLGGVGLFLSLVVVMIWQSPADHESWLSELSAKMFFLLMVGSIAGYAFYMALGGAPTASRPAPPTLAELCPACGHLASGGARSSPCPRCGLEPGPQLYWEETHAGSRFDDLVLASMMSSLGFLGLFLLAQIASGAVHGVKVIMCLVLGLLLGAFGLFGPMHLVTQVRERRRTRGHYAAKHLFSPGSSVWSCVATARLDRHDQLVSAEGSTTFRTQTAPADPGQLDPRRAEVVRALALLERHGHVAVIDSRLIRWSRQARVPRVERFDYRAPTSDEAWTCHEQLRPRIMLTSGTEEDGSGTVIHGWMKPDAGRIKRLSEVLAIEVDREVSLDDVLDRLEHDGARRAALLAIAGELADESDDDEDDDGEVTPVTPDEKLERRVSQLAGWLVA